MKNVWKSVAVLIASVSLHGAATDRFYSDIKASSPDGRFEVRASSPDNQGAKRRPFQSGFVYSMTDKKTGATLWTRKQAMEEPTDEEVRAKKSSSWPKEGSPGHIFVATSGWMVVWTGWNEFIVVDAGGRDRGKINLLKEAFTDEENRRFVRDTTAGPMWAGYSLWYFLDADRMQLFVIRPWWGRRVVINVETGKLVKETATLSSAALAHERNQVLAELVKGVATRGQWEKKECCETLSAITRAAYLAGCLGVTSAIPLLVKLEDCESSGSSTSGSAGMGEKFEGEVNPHSYSTRTIRQVVQLSLRRLDQKPRNLPVHVFKTQFSDYAKNQPYVPASVPSVRHLIADKVTKGMKAEQVLDLIGSPDFVGYSTWEYDMDSTPPYTLILKWGVREVTGVEKKTPASWQDGFTRDEEIAN